MLARFSECEHAAACPCRGRAKTSNWAAAANERYVELSRLGCRVADPLSQASVLIVR